MLYIIIDYKSYALPFIVEEVKDIQSCWALVSLCRQHLYLCFCRAQFLVARALSSFINYTSVNSAIWTMWICPAFERTKPHTVAATHTGARFAVKVSWRLQTCVVTWHNILGSQSSNVTFAAASFVIHKITSDIWNNIQKNHSEINSWYEEHLNGRIYSSEPFFHAHL